LGASFSLLSIFYTGLRSQAQKPIVKTGFLPPSVLARRVEVCPIFRRAYYDLMQQKGLDTPDIEMEGVTIEVP